MKSFEIPEFGIEHLKLVDRETPQPGSGQVLVRVRAASLNYRDYLVVKGAYNPKMRLPMIPLSDGAGIVEAVGGNVTRFKPGDRVVACFMQTWLDGPPTKDKGNSALGGSIDGVLREYAVFSQDGLLPTPSYLTDEEAATLPCAAVTAWHALFEHTPALPGQSVLLQGTGGVSIFALQFAKAAGLRTIVTSSSDEKLTRARELGASETINYKANPHWEKLARELTGGEGVDHIIEVGGSDTLPRSLRAVRTGGVISLIGILSGSETTLSPAPILMNSVRLQGIYVGSRAMFANMNRALELHRIKPVISKSFPWTDFPAALRHLESQSHFGKIALTVSSAGRDPSAPRSV
ncbi:MAG TPA: NAD(P)-dependent alcohol dehydrogenase [Bryobacteraceae bacterium]|nr:NAD(P)-dependent alcohol dehydrogenase [Bryobacteraceae bacterium]